MGNKFILEGDNVNLDSEADEIGQERKGWITAVVHVSENRQPDGRWEGSFVYVKNI